MVTAKVEKRIHMPPNIKNKNKLLPYPNNQVTTNKNNDPDPLLTVRVADTNGTKDILLG